MRFFPAPGGVAALLLGILTTIALSGQALAQAPWDSVGCASAVATFNILPGFSWGTAPPETRDAYTTSGCDAKICEFWKATYGVLPYKSWGILPDAFKPSWDWPRPSFGNRTCNSLAGSLDATGCGAVVAEFGLLPGNSWGSATSEAMGLYLSSGCDAKICEFWRATYGNVPYGSWGNLPAELHPSWSWQRPSFGNKTCNSLSGLLDVTSCGAVVESYGILPGSSWGSAPPEARDVYTASGCDAKVCQHWRATHGVVPAVSWGTLPLALRRSWDWKRAAFNDQSCDSLSGSSA